MARDQNESGVMRLLQAARSTMKSARYCWLATTSQDGSPAMRPMGPLKAEAGDDPWTIRFLTDLRSHKFAEIRHAAKVALVFQHGPDDAYAAMTGKAAMIENEADVKRLWRSDYDVFFADEAERRSAAFVDVAIDRMELWIRGVTAEPFGIRATVLERRAVGWVVTAS